MQLDSGGVPWAESEPPEAGRGQKLHSPTPELRMGGPLRPLLRETGSASLPSPDWTLARETLSLGVLAPAHGVPADRPTSRAA